MNIHSNTTVKVTKTGRSNGAEPTSPSTPTENDTTIDFDLLYDEYYGDGESVIMKRTREGEHAVVIKRVTNQHHRWMTVLIGLFLCVCVVFGMYFYVHTRRNKYSSNITSSTSESNSTLRSVANSELQLHNDVNKDCWISVRNKVYDLTEWTSIHPGGVDVLSTHCGKDATKSYIEKHPFSHLSLYTPPITIVGKWRTVASTNSSTSKNVNTTTAGNFLDVSTKTNTIAPSPTPMSVSSNSSTIVPMGLPTMLPILVPADLPTMVLVSVPTVSPIDGPSNSSVPAQTNSSTLTPFTAPTPKPLAAPATVPTSEPTIVSTTKPVAVPTTSPTVKPIPAPTITPTMLSTPCISIDQVMLHSVETDCYYILYDYVFDFTDYINLHPGGPKKVLTECGTDATVVYETEKLHNEDLLYEVNAYDLYGVGYAC